MSYTITIQDRGRETVLSQSDTAMSAEFRQAAGLAAALSRQIALRCCAPDHPRLASGKFESAETSGAGSPEDSRIAATRATKSPMTRFARSVSSLSRIGPCGSVAHMVLMQSRVRDNKSTTVNIGAMEGWRCRRFRHGFRLRRSRNSMTFCIVRFQTLNSR